MRWCVVLVAVVLAGCGGDDGGGGGGATTPKPRPGPDALTRLARAAKCTVTNADPGAAGLHTRAAVKYDANPPIGGPHADVWSRDRVYPRAKPPDLEESVHALEHGRINLQYAPDLSAADYAKLRALYDEGDGFHALLFANQTKMPYAIAATAWGRSIGCPAASAPALAALREFRKRYTDKAPELVP